MADPSFPSLRVRLAAVALLALLPVLALTVYTGRRQYQLDGEAAGDHAVRLARHVSFVQRELLERTHELLLAMTKSPAVRDLDAERCRAFTSEEQRLGTPYVNLGVADAEGRVIASTVTGLVSVASEPWFQRALQLRDFSVGDYKMNAATGRATLTAGYPLLDGRQTARAVVFAMMDFQWVGRLTATMELPEGASVMVLDRRGETLQATEAEEAFVEEALRSAVAERVTAGVVRGVRWLYGVVPLYTGQKKPSVFVVVAIPTATAFARAHQNLIHDVVLWVLAALLMLVALAVAGHVLFVRPIQVVIAATKRLARGDLNTRVGSMGGGRELGQLGRSFDEMAEALASQSSQLEQSEERFRQVVETSPLGMHFWRLQPDGRLLFTGANRAADEMLGIEHGPLVGKPILEAFPWLVGTEVSDRYREVCVLGIPWHSEETRYVGDQVAGIYEVFAFRTVPGSMAAMFSNITERRKAIEALRESEQRFRQLFENSPDAIFVESHDGIVLDVNPAACRLHGLSREKLVGRHVTELVPPEHRDQVSRDFPKIVSGEWTSFEGQSYTAFGQVVPVEISAARINYAGRVAILLQVRDVSTRKSVELALLESETRFRHLSEATFEAIVLTDAGHILDANSRLVEMLGYQLTELIGKPLTDLVAPESLDTVVEYKRSGSAKPIEFLARRKNGTTVPVEARSRIVPYKGHRVRVIAMRDTTEEKRTQETMQRLATAIEQTVEAIVITDPQGKILYANPSFEAITGYTVDEALGQTPRILKSGKHDAAFYRDLWNTISRGEVWRGFFLNRKKDGTIYQEEATISPIKDAQGRITSYVAVKRDVTHEVALELQLLQSQKMEAIGRLAGGLAHDFNNTLTTITGYGELSIRRLPEGDPLRRNIEEILKAADRAANLTHQLLAFSRKQVLETKLLDLNELVANIQSMLRRTIGEDVELAIRLEQSPPWLIKADRSQIEQVLLNLVVNARDAMPLGGKLTVMTANVTVDEPFAHQHVGMTPGDYVLLSVADTGAGITDEVKSHLFEPFFTTKESGKGTGLGLATSYGIVKQSGGQIVVTTKLGAGTTLDIYLPHAGGEMKTPSRTVVIEESSRSRRDETILLVEDEEAVRELAQIILQELGYNVLSAENGVRALQLLHEHQDQRIDLLLTDVRMPQMGGRELAERMRQITPNLKILFTTGYSAEAEGISRMLSHITFYLPKPFTPTAIGRKVREVLDA